MSDALPANPPADDTRRRGTVAAAILAFILLLSLGLEARVWLRSPTAADYARAAEYVRAGMAPGDAFTTAPAWALRPLQDLGELRGVGITAARAGLALGVARLWVVADPDARADLRLLDAAYTRGESRSFGPLDVVTYTVAPTPGWHGASMLERARVTLHKRNGPAEGIACSQPATRGRGFLCPAEPDWLRTTAEWADVGGIHSGGDLAIWGHPPAPGDRKTLVWDGVDLAGTLVLGGTHTEHGARNARESVRVSVTVDGRPLAQHDFAPRHGWSVVRFPVPADLAGQRSVAVEITSANNQANHFMFDVGVLP